MHSAGGVLVLAARLLGRAQHQRAGAARVRFEVDVLGQPLRVAHGAVACVQVDLPAARVQLEPVEVLDEDGGPAWDAKYGGIREYKYTARAIQYTFYVL